MDNANIDTEERDRLLKMLRDDRRLRDDFVAIEELLCRTRAKMEGREPLQGRTDAEEQRLRRENDGVKSEVSRAVLCIIKARRAVDRNINRAKNALARLDKEA